jgi:hypothetical protein
MLNLQYVHWRWSSWMEVRVTGHNFENWPHKDHPCHVSFKLAYWFQRRRFLNIFPIESYVKTMSADGGHLGWRLGFTGYNFESWPFKDHSYHVCFKLAYWFQRKMFLNIFHIWSYVKIMSADGGHLGWRSGSHDIILKVDHLRTIHAMFALNWLTGFRGEAF